MKKRISALLAAAAALCTACGPGAAEKAPSSGQSASSASAVIRITAEEAKRRMDAGGVIVLDVRTEAEYAEAHIPGARLLPNETIAEAPAGIPKDAQLLVYCRSGRRSAEAARKLLALGYEHVYDFGGIIDWPFETESGAPQNAGKSSEGAGS